MILSIFALWGVVVAVGLGAMSQASCETDEEVQAARIGPTLVAGWRVHYWLSSADAAGLALATLLTKRGPLPAAGGEIYLVGESGDLAQRLRSAGWAVRPGEGEAKPRMEIYAPDGSLRWSGPFRGLGTNAEGEYALDLVILEKVARSEAVPPFVPTGCAVKQPREAAATSWQPVKFLPR